MAAYQIYNFPTHLKGDTFPGVQFTLIIDEVPRDIIDIGISMKLRSHRTATNYIAEYTLTGGHFSLVDGANGVFRFNSQIIDIPAGEYYYDIQFSFEDGSVKTYITGKWTIIQDLTYG